MVFLVNSNPLPPRKFRHSNQIVTGSELATKEDITQKTVVVIIPEQGTDGDDNGAVVGIVASGVSGDFFARGIIEGGST